MILLNAAPGIPIHGPSGASAHLRGLANALRPRVLVTARAEDRRGRFGAVDVPVVAVGVPGWPSWLASWRGYAEVWTARRVAGVALAQAREAPLRGVWERHSLFSDAGWRVHRATGAPWLLEVNAPLVDERLRYEALPRVDWARGWEREVLRAAPVVAGVSSWLCDWLDGLGCRRVVHLPNGVVPHRGDRAGTRRALGLEEAFVIGFVGSMKPWHGVERLPAILDAVPDAVGLVVGDGEVPPHPRLRRVGHVEEDRLADLVAAMDVGLAPYAADAPAWFCPLKVLAYRAQGTPVVATDVGDCRALVGEGGTVGPDLVEAIRAWRGRRAAPWVRSWEVVVAEGLGALGVVPRSTEDAGATFR